MGMKSKNHSMSMSLSSKNVTESRIVNACNKNWSNDFYNCIIYINKIDSILHQKIRFALRYVSIILLNSL